ncbi:AMP-binding protein [Micromonospora sp. NPDC005413]|uniref:AMP-binding protein n=1 Tax=Micromonospora sp. NPDC005413 TaxID=3154563 RepID=UPI0033B5504F
MSWDLARLWHALAEQQPDLPALIHDGHTLTWRQFDTAAAGFAARLRQAGIRRGDVVALCLPNVLEYLILVAGAMRCGATPCGVNYRYRSHELAMLLRHLQPAVVCHDLDSEEDLDRIRDQLTEVRRWYAVDHRANAGSLARLLLETGGDRDQLDSRPDDVLLKCTGGTTGRPTAVRWFVGDVLTQLNDHNPWHQHDLAHDGPKPAPVEPVRLLVVSPLMHGSGLTRAIGALCAGGTVVTQRGFQPLRLLNGLARHHATSLAIVGDAHALPLVDMLDAEPGRWQLPDLATITSSGVSWTAEVKRRLLHHLPQVRLLESLGATEATGLGFNVATASNVPRTGEFVLGRHARVFAANEPARPGHTGTIGVSWPHPAGLHPSGQLPADRFTDHAGHRYLLSGDHVRLLDDERYLLLGRAGECINTGGEKVYAPEITDTLRRHPGVRDALVLGVPHPRLGQTVTALVQLSPGTTTENVREYARAHLAGFKAPTIVVGVPAIPRTGAGKPDLTTAHTLAAQHTGGTA